MGFNIADTGKKRVVIIGGGFGGLKLANRLKGSNFQTEKLLFPACRSESDRTGKEPCADLYRQVEI